MFSEKIASINSIEKAQEDSIMNREVLNVLKIRAAGDFSMTKWKGAARNITANNIDQIVHTREEANYLCACIHYFASEMVANSIYGAYYQDMTLSGILLIKEIPAVVTEAQLAMIDAEKDLFTKTFYALYNRIDSTHDAKRTAVNLRHFIYVMEKQASGDFTKAFYDTNAGGIWNAFVRNFLSQIHEAAVTTKEEANLLVAEARLFASQIVATYPPQFAIFFRDLTLSYRKY
uniref:Uncharacterized protein n=1 Tax=Panagrolaimus sp. ES5 TaxID=591445 RepID=A0AC34G6N4_9BILA